MNQQGAEIHCGRAFTPGEIEEIREVVESCGGLSRRELANTVCELWEWKRPTGALKTLECLQFLESLEEAGRLRLPARRNGKPRGSKARVGRSEKGEPKSRICGDVSLCRPVELRPVESKEARALWYEYVDRYHYLGYQLPYGAQLRYFIIGSVRSREQVLGCVQFSSPAWKMAARDRWIGWAEEQRRCNLQKVVNQSRFLLLPWVEVKNLASTVLGLCARRVAGDWEARYGYRPVLLESLVDAQRFEGTCYKAANWIYAGMTTGRGRMDRKHRCEGRSPKKIYLYPLSARFRDVLLSA